jgi:ABC-2 type transport system permease protein
MTGYRILMRVLLRENFTLKRILGASASKSKAKMILVIFAIIYALGVFLFSFGWMFFKLGEAFSMINFTEMLLLYIFSYISGFMIMMSLFRADGYLFHYKDYDLIASLPLKPVAIIAAKATIMMINLYIIAFLVCIPMIFSYIYFTPITVLTIVYLIIALFVSPLVPIILSSLLSMIVARITVRLKHAHIFKILLMLILFFGMMALSFSFSFTGGDNPLINQQEFISALGQIYLPMQWFVQSVHQTNILSLLLLMVTHLGLFTLFIFGIAKISMKINSQSGINVGIQNYTPITSQSRTVFKSLLVKEFRTYLGITFYVLNTGIGIIFMLIAGIASLFFKEKVVAFLNDAVGVSMALEPLLLLFIGFCMSTIYTSAISLSLEGKKFAFLKSLPIRPQTIMSAKIVFNILLGLPVAILTLILFTITFNLPFVSLIFMILTVISFSLLSSSFGSVLNLYFPKFDFINEIEVIKQGLSSLLAIFGGFGFLAINGVIYYHVGQASTSVIALLSITFINLTLAVLAYLLMKNKCESLFIKMI